MCAPAEKKPSLLKKFVNANFKWIVSLSVEIAWLIWALLDPKEHFGRFVEETPFVGQYYYMAITMVFGSLVAGATSEGGGAVAFPVMTLALGVPTIMARDFSFAIQSFGMSCASIMIWFLKVPLDNEAMIWGSVGGTTGLIIGLEGIAPFLRPEYSKMFFVSLWLSFAVALFRLNTRKERTVYDSAAESDRSMLEHHHHVYDISAHAGNDDDAERPALHPKTISAKRKRIATLTAIGIFGGICSSIAGSGLDMATFSMLTLYYRVSEKIATPTSVVLMAINAVMGMLLRLIPYGGAYEEGEKEVLWKFVSVCIPVVVIGAPLGAHIPTILNRHQISYILYFLSSAQFILACIVVKPWSKPAPHGVGTMVASGVTLIGGSIYFYLVADWGESRDLDMESKATAEADIEENDEIKSEDIKDETHVESAAVDNAITAQ